MGGSYIITIVAMRASDAGIAFIQSWEALRLTAYTATADEAQRGIWTIGYGSTYWPNGKPVKQGDTLADEAEASLLFSITLDDFEMAVCSQLVWPIEQHRFDALVSLAYNIGAQAFRSSTIARMLQSSDAEPDHQAIASQFLRWNKQSGKVLAGLVRRRAEERKMYLGLEFQNNV